MADSQKDNLAEINSILTHMVSLLQAGEYQQADECCNYVLSLLPGYGPAYVGKLLAEYHLKEPGDLLYANTSYTESVNYKNALYYSDAETQRFLRTAPYENYYLQAHRRMTDAQTDDDLLVAGEMFRLIPDYRDSAELSRRCIDTVMSRHLEEQYQKAESLREAASDEADLRAAADAYSELNAYKDSASKRSDCLRRAENLRKDSVYNSAANPVKCNNIRDLQDALEKYESLRGWKDSRQKADMCRYKIADLEKAAKSSRKRVLLIGIAVLAVAGIALGMFLVIFPLSNYNRASELMRDGAYADAAQIFSSLNGFRDSAEKARECDLAIQEQRYQAAILLYDSGSYEQADELFSSLSGYKDSDSRARESETAILEQRYQAALALLDAGKYEEATAAFAAMEGYKDSEERARMSTDAILSQRYDVAQVLLESGQYNEAIEAFTELDGYSDSVAKIAEAQTAIQEQAYQSALALLEAGQYNEAIEAFTALDSYSDSAVKITEAQTAIQEQAYQSALALLEAGQYTEAIEAFTALDDYSDSAAKITEAQTAIQEQAYQSALALLEEGQYTEAIEAFTALDGYSDSAAKIAEAQTAIQEQAYQSALALLEEGQYTEAIEAFTALDGYSDSAVKITEAQTAILEQAYQSALALLEEGQYTEAIEAFTALDSYSDSAAKIAEAQTAIQEQAYQSALALLEEGQYTEAIEAFTALDDYSDSVAKITEAQNAIQEQAYQSALEMLGNGEYDAAVVAFTALNGYYDSEGKLAEAYSMTRDGQYDEAVQLLESGSYNEAIDILQLMNGYRDSDKLIEQANLAEIRDLALTAPKEAAKMLMELESDTTAAAIDEMDADTAEVVKGYLDLFTAGIGASVRFGRFEQDANETNGIEAVEWIVLDRQENTLTLISSSVLSALPYHTDYEDVTWEGSSLRIWLNGEFYEKTFSEVEKEMILLKPVPAADKMDEAAAEDYVTLLSVDEAEHYFPTDVARIAAATPYAVENGISLDPDGNATWWLRTPGFDSRNAAYVYSDGSIHRNGIYVTSASDGVRPVIMIELQ